MDETKIRELLLRESGEFRKLHEEHQSCERKLALFKGKSFLTEDEKLEEREIKKRKLALKDRMYALMTQYGGGR